MKIKYLNNDEYDQWNEFVELSSQGSIFSTTWYLDALQVQYKILTIVDNEKIEGGIVLTKNEFNSYSNPMFDKYLGVLFTKNTNNSLKVTSKQYKLSELLTKELKKIRSFDYYFHPEYKNWIPFYWNNFTQQLRYTYRINFKHTMEQIFNNFHSNLKNDIKNARKQKVVVKSDISFDEFYNTVNKTFLRQGSKAPFSRSKISKFANALSKRTKFVSFGAFNENGKIISVCGLVYDQNSSYLLFNGIDIDNQIRGANALMILETIEFFQDKCNYYDFEGSMLKGVEPFYRRFGGELTPYMRIWNDNLFNYLKAKTKILYKKIRYGR